MFSDFDITSPTKIVFVHSDIPDHAEAYDWIRVREDDPTLPSDLCTYKNFEWAFDLLVRSPDQECALKDQARDMIVQLIEQGMKYECVRQNLKLCIDRAKSITEEYEIRVQIEHMAEFKSYADVFADLPKTHTNIIITCYHVPVLKTSEQHALWRLIG